jgi:hypothetical protein
MQRSRGRTFVACLRSLDTFPLKRNAHNSTVTMETGMFSVGSSPRLYSVTRGRLGSSDVENIGGLNLAVVKLTTVQMTKLPL